MDFVFNFTTMKGTQYTKEAEEVVQRALNKLSKSHISSDRINRIVFYYNYSLEGKATIRIVFEEVEKKRGFTINQITYIEEFDNKDNSLKIFESIISTLNTNGYEVFEKKFLKGQKLKKSAKIEQL